VQCRNKIVFKNIPVTFFNTLLLAETLSHGGLDWKKLTALPLCPPVKPLDKAVFSVGGLKMAGLDFVEQRLLYFREEAAMLWDHLDEFLTNAKRGLEVEGCPGVGKSCKVWSWLCSVNVRSQDTSNYFAIWIHISSRMIAYAVILGKNDLLWRKFNPNDAPAMLAFIRQSHIKLIILDGFRDDEQCLVSIRAEAFSSDMIEKIIIVKSMGGKRHFYDDQIDDVSIIKISPWTEGEYLEAVSNFDFLRSILPFLDPQGRTTVPSEEVCELVSRKFHYVGGSARLMFAMSTDDAMRASRANVHEIRDKEIFCQGRVGTTSPSSRENVDH
jgi:hypothetical protein